MKLELPFGIGKKKEPPVMVMQAPESDVQERKATDQVDLISRFLEVYEKDASLSSDYIMMASNDNTEEFTRSMTKCAINAETIITQGARRYLEHEKNVVAMQEEWGHLAKAWGKEAFVKWKKERLEKAQKDCDKAVEQAKLARKIIAAEPHMVAILRRNRGDNRFAKGAFEGDKLAKDEENGQAGLDKLASVLGKGSKSA